MSAVKSEVDRLKKELDFVAEEAKGERETLEKR
jgi:hypothetical protein